MTLRTLWRASKASCAPSTAWSWTNGNPKLSDNATAEINSLEASLQASAKSQAGIRNEPKDTLRIPKLEIPRYRALPTPAQTLDASYYLGCSWNPMNGIVYGMIGPNLIGEEMNHIVRNADTNTINIYSSLRGLISFGHNYGYQAHHYVEMFKTFTRKHSTELAEQYEDMEDPQEMVDELMKQHFTENLMDVPYDRLKMFKRGKDEPFMAAMSRHKTLVDAHVDASHPVPPIRLDSPNNGAERARARERKRITKQIYTIRGMVALVHPSLKEEVCTHMWPKHQKGYEINFKDDIRDVMIIEIQRGLRLEHDLHLGFFKGIPEKLFHTEAKRARLGNEAMDIDSAESSLRSSRDYAYTGQKRRSYDGGMPRDYKPRQDNSPRRFTTARQRSQSGSRDRQAGANRLPSRQGRTPSRDRYSAQSSRDQPCGPCGALVRKLNEQVDRARSSNPRYNSRMSRRDNYDHGRGRSASRPSYRDRSGSTYRSGSRTRYTRCHQYGKESEAIPEHRYRSGSTGFYKILPGVTVPYNYSHTRAPDCCIKCGVNHKTAYCLSYKYISDKLCSICERGMHSERECKLRRRSMDRRRRLFNTEEELRQGKN